VLCGDHGIDWASCFLAICATNFTNRNQNNTNIIYENKNGSVNIYIVIPLCMYTPRNRRTCTQIWEPVVSAICSLRG